jgi:hypothetical protein
LGADTAEVLEERGLAPVDMKPARPLWARVSSGDPGFLASRLADIKRRGNDVSASTLAPGDKVVRAR